MTWVEEVEGAIARLERQAGDRVLAIRQIPMDLVAAAVADEVCRPASWWQAQLNAWGIRRHAPWPTIEAAVLRIMRRNNLTIPVELR